MTRTITIADYGAGNLYSLARAIEQVGARPFLCEDPDAFARADSLILPGVGAFGHCAAQLVNAGMVAAIKAFAATGRPFLGICVGMQLMFEEGHEFGRHPGLGLIAGAVDAIPSSDDQGSRKVPHIGWSALRPGVGQAGWAGSLLADNIAGSDHAYFVHSYCGQPTNSSDILATVDYAGFTICAAVQRDNVQGVQFHPEKSGPAGLKMLAQFAGH